MRSQQKSHQRRLVSSSLILQVFVILIAILTFLFATSSFYLIKSVQNNNYIGNNNYGSNSHHHLPDRTNTATLTEMEDGMTSIDSPSSYSIYHESTFVYSNTTYSYRYSPTIFTKTKKNRNQTQQTNVDTTEMPKIIFGICSNSQKPIRRNSIRKSWTLDSEVAILSVYIVAGNFDTIKKEFYTKGDLLWVNVTENYRTGLTPKTLAFVDFGGKVGNNVHQSENSTISNNHIEFDYIFKTDDDVYVNATHIGLELYNDTRQRQRQEQQYNGVDDIVDYYGMIKSKYSPIRDKSDERMAKWYMSREEYPQDYFPDYAPGVGYALSNKFANCASRMIPHLQNFMPWEDVAVGLLAELCQVTLKSADENWDHFSLLPNSNSALDFFPYEKYKDGGHDQLVKILHKVQPWYFEPLYNHQSLVDANNYIQQKKKDTRNRRQQQHNGAGNK